MVLINRASGRKLLERVGQQLCGDMNIKGMEGGEWDIQKLDKGMFGVIEDTRQEGFSSQIVSFLISTIFPL